MVQIKMPVYLDDILEIYMKIKLFVFIYLLSFHVGINAQEIDDDIELNEINYAVSLIRLIANPDHFDKKRVNVTGYMSKRGVWYIFFSKDMCVNFSYSDSIYINPTEIEKDQFAKISPEYKECDFVSVTGEFEASKLYGTTKLLTHLLYTEGSIKSVVFY